MFFGLPEVFQNGTLDESVQMFKSSLHKMKVKWCVLPYWLKTVIFCVKTFIGVLFNDGQ